MTPSAQPLLVPAPAACPIPTRDPQARRLITVWADLAVRAACASAHDLPDANRLRALQSQVEDALTTRLRRPHQVLSQLTIWESALVHVSQTPPESCLICRRARLQLPLDLPIPSKGGHR